MGSARLQLLGWRPTRGPPPGWCRFCPSLPPPPEAGMLPVPRLDSLGRYFYIRFPWEKGWLHFPLLEEICGTVGPWQWSSWSCHGLVG